MLNKTLIKFKRISENHPIYTAYPNKEMPTSSNIDSINIATIEKYPKFSSRMSLNSSITL